MLKKFSNIIFNSFYHEKLSKDAEQEEKNPLPAAKPASKRGICALHVCWHLVVIRWYCSTGWALHFCNTVLCIFIFIFLIYFMWWGAGRHVLVLGFAALLSTGWPSHVQQLHDNKTVKKLRRIASSQKPSKPTDNFLLPKGHKHL